MNQNARAIKIMDSVASATGLSREAETALIQLVNPFADFDIQKVGYFDTDESSSLIQCVRMSKTIATPPGLAGANWDCHIFSTPLVNATTSMHDCILVGGIALTTAVPVNPGNFGGVTVVTGATGADLSLGGACRSATTICDSSGLCPIYQQGGGAPSYIEGLCRIIGTGFEVHNTTAAINLQGSVAVYRKPQQVALDKITTELYEWTAGSILAPTAAQTLGAVTIARIDDVPSSLAEALILNGSRQWEAKDGCMIVPTLNDSNITPQRLGSVMPIVGAGGATLSATLTGIASAATILSGERGVACYPQTPVFTPFIDNPPTLKGIRSQVYKQHISNFNTGGAYFTGLSATTTLTINSIYYIERFPSQDDTDLVVMANPSPPFSSAAMNLYPELLRHLPVGVKVGDNADGDWFFQAVKSLADTLNPVLPSILPVGLAQGAQMFAKGASTWADNKLIERNPKKKKNVPVVVVEKRKQPGPKPKIATKVVTTNELVGKPPHMSIEAWMGLTKKQRAMLRSRNFKLPA